MYRNNSHKKSILFPNNVIGSCGQYDDGFYCLRDDFDDDAQQTGLAKMQYCILEVLGSYLGWGTD
jgi:hypothetical protein